MFPDIPDGVKDVAPFDLQALVATEQGKSQKLMDEQRKKNRARTVQTDDSYDDIIIPEGVSEEWERDYFDYLTNLMTEHNLSVIDIHFLVSRYGSYLIKYRSMYNSRPSMNDIERN
jgi:hypothetical protein